MQKDKEIVQALLTLTAISNRTDNRFEEKLHQILLEVIKCLGTETGSIMTLTGRRFLEVRAATNPEIVGFKQPLRDDAPSAWVFKNKEVLYADKHNPDETIRNQYGHYKKRAYLIAPILNGDKVIGVLSVTDKKNADRFNKEEQKLLLGFAGQLINAIENNRLAVTLKKKKIELQQKNKKLKKLEELRKELFDMLIHDLKGPISNIVANVDILTYTTNKENMEYVASAQASCDTLYRMTSDLLDITRLEEGSLKLYFERISAAELLSEGIARVYALARIRSVQLLEKESEKTDQCFLYGDRGMLLRVLQNLIINAMYHSKKGQKIEAGFERDNSEYWRFYVKDQGPGVPAEYQNAIFDKFFQVNKKEDGRVYSTGLGLAFCRLAVEAHNGQISIESDGKSGSCFYFSIPRIEP
jgi:K+-sensing histidine kinase KdpD